MESAKTPDASVLPLATGMTDDAVELTPSILAHCRPSVKHLLLANAAMCAPQRHKLSLEVMP